MLTITSYSRTPGKKLAPDQIPVEIYGHNITENFHRYITQKDIHSIRKGDSKLMNIDVDGRTYKIYIKEVQYDPIISDKILSLCFFNVDDNKYLKVKVKINFTNIKDSPIIKAGGNINIVQSEAEVYFLGKDIIQEIECDLRNIKKNNSIFLKDLDWPKEAYIHKNIPIVSILNAKE